MQQTQNLPVDQVFYNMVLNNDQTATANIPVIFDKVLDRSILPGKTNDWESSSVRFSVPLFSVPLFTYIPGSEKLTLTFSTYSTTQDVPIVDRSAIPIYNYQVFEMTQYMQMLNQCVQNCCDILDAQYYAVTSGHLSIVTSTAPNPTYDPLLPISLTNLEFIQTFTKPYFIYDKLTERISVYAKDTYFEDTVTNIYKLLENNALYTKIKGIDDYYTGILNMEHQIFFHDNLDNIDTNGIIQNMQQSDNFSNLTDFVGVEITTNMPCQLQYTDQGTGENIFISYIPTKMTIADFHSNLIYNAIIPYNQSQLLSDSVLSELMFRVRWTNIRGEKTLLDMPPNTHAEIKIFFQRRESAKY